MLVRKVLHCQTLNCTEASCIIAENAAVAQTIILLGCLNSLCNCSAGAGRQTTKTGDETRVLLASNDLHEPSIPSICQAIWRNQHCVSEVSLGGIRCVSIARNEMVGQVVHGPCVHANHRRRSDPITTPNSSDAAKLKLHMFIRSASQSMPPSSFCSLLRHGPLGSETSARRRHRRRRRRHQYEYPPPPV